MNEVSRALAESLEAAFAGALAVVALAADDRLGVRIAATAGDGFDRAAHATPVTQVAEDAYAASAPIALPPRRSCAPAPAASRPPFAGARRSLYAAAAGHRRRRPRRRARLLFGDDRALDDSEEALVAAQADAGGDRHPAHARARAGPRRRRPAAAEPAARAPPEIEGLDLARATTPAARASRSAATGTTSCIATTGSCT